MEVLEQASRRGRRVALATVVRTEGSAPRVVGTSMVVSDDGALFGSVSGGCVEASVFEAARDVLASGKPELHRFGISDDDSFAIGLTCGGTIEIFIQPFTPDSFPHYAALQLALRENLPCAMVTIFDGPPELVGNSELVLEGEEFRELFGVGELPPDLVSAAAVAVQDAIASGTTMPFTLPAVVGMGLPLSLLIDAYRPPRRLLIVGAIDFSASLAELGAFLGFRVTVCDARAVFATAERIPAAHEIVVDQPGRYLRQEIARGRIARDSAICVLTHDAKFDVPVLDEALRHGFAYIGAMGSRRTARDRRARLILAGHTEETLAPLRSPIGLDLSAATSAETAVSIMAEIIASKNRASGLPLSQTNQPIHKGAPTLDGEYQSQPDCPVQPDCPAQPDARPTALLSVLGADGMCP
ncbi:XdhC family protein [Paenarthrobacter aromaticivorans]|uniref:XdhC family protein n=1 Tax=Paenarthrobacter aromaticivorans TaxID=2849150 RepID=UPI003A7FD360